MAGRKSMLTEELIKAISEHIESGVYDYIACEAVGISQSTFYEWLQDAEKEDADPLKVEFSESVKAAKANARMKAEKRVLEEQPATWLLKGPGREKPGRPGWSNENTINLQPGDTPVRLTWGDTENADDANS